jgi:hypothetical protein
MATGDTQDFIGRIRAALPARWFPLTQPGFSSATPVLDAILTGLANTWSWFYSLYAYVNLQTRIATATDTWLDLTALDFLGGTVFRKPGEPDARFSTRIRKEIVRLRDTRAGLVQALVDLTGRTPTVFEPAMAYDTGGYGFTGMTTGTHLAYNMVSGGYGSLALPFQCFVQGLRPFGGGIPLVGGYYLGSGWAGGGYSTLTSFNGALEWAQLSQSIGQVTDLDIDHAIVSVMPAATIAWTNVSNTSAPNWLDGFILDTSILG